MRFSPEGGESAKLAKEVQEQHLEIGLHEWNDEIKEDERQAEIAKMKAELGVDALTGLKTRKVFTEDLENALKYIRGEINGRAGEHIKDISVLFIDLDNFKEVNDTLGHSKGDTALKQVAEVLKNSVRDTDVVARFGGDEFYILLPRVKAVEAVAIGNKVLSNLNNDPNLKQLNIGASIGVSTSSMSTNATELVDFADMAAKHAKQSGKNRVALATEPEQV
jgi:diguanylate cyclase (GGDEF)-like protein